MSLRDLRAQLTRLKARAERKDAPTFDEYWFAARRETARRLRGIYERLARIGDTPTTPYPARDQELLADDTPEQAAADRRIIEMWEKANGAPDIKGAADEARTRLLDTRSRWTCAR